MRTVTALAVILISCSSNSGDKLHHDAILVHNAMMQRAEQLEGLLGKLKNDSSVNQDSVVALSSSFKAWASDLVEVPGNEEHDHKGHSHNHAAAPEITEEQMLLIQKELDTRLSHIEQRAMMLDRRRKVLD